MRLSKTLLQSVCAAPVAVVLLGSLMNHTGVSGRIQAQLIAEQKAPLVAVQAKIQDLWNNPHSSTFHADLYRLEAQESKIQADISTNPTGNHPAMWVPNVAGVVELTPVSTSGAFDLLVNNDTSFSNIAATFLFAMAVVPNLLLFLSIAAFLGVTFTPTKQSMV
jgi:hypothetical protein